MSERNHVFKRCGCRTEDGRLLGVGCPRLRRHGHGTWCFTLELPPDRHGGRQRVRRGGFATRKAALHARGLLLGTDVNPDPAVVTVGQWLDVWMETKTLAFSTRRLYTQHIRDYLKPYLGTVPLAELSTGRVQAMFTAIIRARSWQGRPISGATLQRIRGVLHAALNAAIRRELLTRNPAHWIELPSARRPRAVVWTDGRVEHWRATGERPRVAVWTPQQTAAFLAHLQGREHYVLFLLTALLGLRRGEAAGLRWCDVDLATRELSVSHQVQDHNGHTVICPPKTEHSVRTVALARFATTALMELRSEQRGRLPSGQEPTGFIFTNPSGKPWSPGYLTHTFARLVAEADLPPIRLHDLRHGAASLSLAAGNELKIVQAMLGHSSIVLTADTYVSVEPCIGHKAAEATATLVLRAARRDSLRIRGVRPKRRRRQRPRAVTKAQKARARAA